MKYKKFKSLHQINNKLIAPTFEKAGLTAEAWKIQSCGDFIHTIKCDHCGTQHFKGFSRCKSRYCAICNKAKSMLWLAKLYPYLKSWVDSGNYIVFVNYTIRDREKLTQGLEVLQDAWRYMTHDHKQTRKEFKKRYVGGVKSLEVKIGENSGKWHPHLHTMVLKREYTKDDYDFLAPAWAKSVEYAGGGKYGTDEQEGLVYLEAFGAYNKRRDRKKPYEERLLKSIMEVVKYMTKFDYVNDTTEHLEQMYFGLKGIRQLSTWGVLYKIPREVEQELDSMTDDQIKQFVCQICGCTEGTFDKLYKEVWRDEYIVDYSKQQPAETDEQKIERLRELNGLVEKIETEYIQEQFEIYGDVWR